MRPWYRFGRWLCSVFFHAVYKMEAYHPQRVPAQGGFILAANHASYYDPPLAGCACPREIFYLGRKSLFRFWWSNWLLRSVNVVPVDVDGHALGALKTALHLLEAGHGVLLFPEGTRSPDGRLLPPQPGAGWMVLKAGVPVVPCRIWGTNVALPRHGKGRRTKIEVKFGRPMTFDPRDLPSDRRQACETIARRIMEAIAALEPNADPK